MTDLTAKQAAVELVQTNHAFTQLEAALFAKMMASESEETAKRDSLFFAIKALRGAKAALMVAASGQHIDDYTQTLEEAGLIAPRP